MVGVVALIVFGPKGLAEVRALMPAVKYSLSSWDAWDASKCDLANPLVYVRKGDSDANCQISPQINTRTSNL